MKKKLKLVHRLDIVIALYIFFTLTSELLGAKTFPLVQIGSFTLNTSVAIFVLPFVFSITDVILEVYGKERARSVAFLGLGTIVLLILYTTLATGLPPSTRFAPTEAAYDTIFQQSIRMSIASIIAFACSQLLDIAVFSRLRERMEKHALWLRNNLSNFVGFFVDSLVFLTITFYAFDMGLNENVQFIVSLLIPYWLIRCALSIAETPFVYAGVKWLKQDLKTTPTDI